MVTAAAARYRPQYKNARIGATTNHYGDYIILLLLLLLRYQIYLPTFIHNTIVFQYFDIADPSADER